MGPGLERKSVVIGRKCQSGDIQWVLGTVLFVRPSQFPTPSTGFKRNKFRRVKLKINRLE